MSVNSITEADIDEASRMADLDDAARLLQDRAGIATGDVAGIFFSGTEDPGERWVRLPLEERAGWLREYLHCERLYE